MKKTYFPLLLMILFFSCSDNNIGYVEVSPTKELRTPDGKLYTPSTQSMLRTYSWLEDTKGIDIKYSKEHKGNVKLVNNDNDFFLELKNLPLSYLLPRLYYKVDNEPDEFDAFNLMLAEFSRNSISVPQGTKGDEMAHFLTDLNETVPWKLKADYDFEPNRYFKPLRVGLVNNCLKPGLWEMNAIDQSGEIYHSWFNFPKEDYFNLVAKTNKLPIDFVKNAMPWNNEMVALDLSRLRTEAKDLGKVRVGLINEDIGFSSQGSRRKIARKFASYKKDGRLNSPEKINDLLENDVVMVPFIEPGIYSFKEHNEYDFSFLSEPVNAAVKTVNPKTSYNTEKMSAPEGDNLCAEICINLADGKKIIMGNLPLHLLVRQEDYVIHGFGVGILSPGGFAERRKFLMEQGPSPSYAYLAKEENGKLVGMNSHEFGIEQIFFRSYPFSETPYWEVTITSYERIIDIVKYKIEMPDRIRKSQQEHSESYVPPVYFTYRDDNIN